MAQQYGGKFSPKGSPDNARDNMALPNKFRGRKAYKSNIRAKLLFIVPLPLLFSGIGELRAGDGIGILYEWGALGILLLAAWLLRDGLIAEDAYNERKISRPPAIPRKIFASVLTGLGVTLATFGGTDAGMITSLIFGGAAILAHSLSFGIDPLRRKGMEGVDEFETERVAKAVEKAEALLHQTIEAANRLNDRALEGRVESLAVAARDMFRTVEEDPRDLARARKFLGVYLKGARDATIKFADLYTRNRDHSARADYEALLTDLETSFAGHREVLLLDDRSDLDVEIEVLRDRLKQEGLTAR